ncbi:HNH endonuclease [Geodermatophilus sp. SYSU D00697]
MKAVLWRLAGAGLVVAAGWALLSIPESPLWLLAIPLCLWLSRRCRRAAARARAQAAEARAAAHRQRVQDEQERARQQREAEARARRDAEIAAIDESRLTSLLSGDLPRLPLPPNRSLPADEWVHFLEPARYVTGNAVHVGDLMVTNRGLYFTGEVGHEVTWARVQGVDSARDLLEVRSTTARGTLRFQFRSMTTLAYAWGSAYGALRVAQRLAVAAQSGERDSRHVTALMEREVYRRDGGKCVSCHATEYLEFDHKIPWSKGGATSVNNLQLLCRRCNAQKGNRI